VLDVFQTSALARYVTRMFLARFALLLAGGAMLAVSADLMETSKDILKDAPDESWRLLLRYVGLRLPVYLSALMPVAALMAGLLTVGALHRHSELVAILNTGLSPGGLIRLLALAGVVLVGLQFALDDWITPRSVKALYAWGIGDYKKRRWQPDVKKQLWLYSSGDIIRLSPTEWDSDRFTDVTVFRRDEKGLLVERIDAPRARYDESGLLLKEVLRRRVSDGTTSSAAEMLWPGVIDFSTIELLAREPRDLRLHQLQRVIDNAGFGQRPPNIYRTWYHARLAATLQPLLMVLLSVSLIPAYSRTRTMAWLLLTGITIGFATFILAGVTTAMGEAGLLPPWLAAWAPSVVLLSLIGRFLLQHEFLPLARRRGQQVA
jgi:lipopolysaccharide export system permease protein